MMDTDKLFKLGKPAFYITAIDDSDFANLYLELNHSHKEAVIRIIRGKKSTSISAFYDETAAALQFPYYFGENSNAFDECITDLEWLQGDAYVLMISDADLFLNDANYQYFSVIIDMLNHANEEWLTPNQYMPRDRKPTPFKILFQCSESGMTAFSQRLAEAGVAFEIL